MALKKITENPKITDTILLEITTPDVDGCFTTNPYKVDNVTVYYVERDVLGTNYGEYENTTFPDHLQKELDKAKKAACENPSDNNLLKLKKVQEEIESSTQKNIFYYKERTPVKIIGDETSPAWLSSDTENSPLVLIEEDDDGNAQFGHFSYEWNPNASIREGDYFICWTWTLLPDGDKLSAHVHFNIEGDGYAVSAVPSHVTPEGKYETLLERFLPETYKLTLTSEDLTPEVTYKLNQSIAQGFTFLEDMANQIIDLFDANALHESMLTYLSNLFAIKLRSNDPTLWRRQIKEAIPLFKKKGTLEGLKQAFAQAGMTLDTLIQYWQIVSPYTWTESFKVKDSLVFELEKDIFVDSVDENNFGLWLKREGEDYVEVSSENIEIAVGDDNVLRMTWVGDQLSVSPLELYEGDRIKVMYQYAEIPDETEQSLENYIQSLPLMDQRDEDDQEFPPKNWNVRLIAESDPLFDVLVPVRHPFYDPLIFGYIRTEFALSENIYNMDEYNGSTRPSNDPCHIAKEFRDPCGACLSSVYSAYVSIEELSNDRIREAQDILREYAPFHTQMHSLNLTGEVNEFVQSPVEEVDMLISMNVIQNVISGQSNPFFNRTMPGGLDEWEITRQDLTDQLTVSSGNMGVAFNNHVRLITPDHILSDLGVMMGNHIFEVLSPSANSGTYSIDQIDGSTARVNSVVNEPVDESAFTFRLSNIIYGNSISTITQDDLVVLSDDEVSFYEIGVKTQWDVENTPDYEGGAWKILITDYSVTPYEIVNIVEGKLILAGDENLPTSNVDGVEYKLLNDEDEEVEEGDSGSLTITRRGYVNLNDTAILNIDQFVKLGDYLYYDGTEYLINEFDGNNFWIEDYVDGDAVGVNVHNRRRLINNGVGYFGYQGLHITTSTDHEDELGILNGSNPPPEDEVTDNSKFKENYLFEIEGEYFKIISIDGVNVVLDGREQNWTTEAAGGTAVEYSIVHFPKKEVEIGFTVFDQLGREGHDPVIREVYSEVDQSTAIIALSASQGSGVEENVIQSESVTFTITTKNGETYEGEL